MKTQTNIYVRNAHGLHQSLKSDLNKNKVQLNERKYYSLRLNWLYNDYSKIYPILLIANYDLYKHTYITLYINKRYTEVLYPFF